MKKIASVVVVFLLFYFCISCEGITDVLYIQNNSDEAVYVCYTCGHANSVPRPPNRMIKAHSLDTLRGGLEGRIWGKPKIPKWPCAGNDMTLFFITEETIQNSSWKEIWGGQMYVKKISFSEDDMRARNWIYTYYP